MVHKIMNKIYRRIGSVILLGAAFTGMMAAQTLTGSGTVRFYDRGYESNDVLFCDSLHLDMTNVTSPSAGKEYYAWLRHDSGTFHKLGAVAVNAGSLNFGFAETSQNLVQHHRMFVISEETAGFSGTQPTEGATRFAGSLFTGNGSPGSDNALTYLRNVIGSFQTPNDLGLLSQLVRQTFKSDNLVQHAILATNQSTVANVKVHTNHAYDFVSGTPDPRVNSGSVANNSDPLGYGFYRYADLDSMYSNQGGAGNHIQLALDQADVTPAMVEAGTAALATLRNTFGANNASGIALDFKNKCLEIIGKTYANVPLAQADANAMKNLAVDLQDSIFAAYRHALDMATIAVEAVSTTGVAETDTPEHFALEQNYPNPFNPATKIGFRIKDRGFVKVSVYDALGRLVDVIADQDMGPGTHSVPWDASGLPSGIYLYRLEVRGERGLMFRAARRGVLLK